MKSTPSSTKSLSVLSTDSSFHYQSFITTNSNDSDLLYEYSSVNDYLMSLDPSSPSASYLKAGKSHLLELYVKPTALIITLFLALIAFQLTRKFAQAYAYWQRRATEYNQRQELVHERRRELVHSMYEARVRSLYNHSSSGMPEPSSSSHRVNRQFNQLCAVNSVPQQWNPRMFEGAANDLVIVRHLAIADVLFCAFVTFFWATDTFHLAIIINGVCQYSVFIYKTSAFVSEWCGAVIGAYHLALQWEHIVGRTALEVFMVLFWLLASAAHWFYVWTLVVTTPATAPVPQQLHSAHDYMYGYDDVQQTTPVTSAAPKPVPVCGPVDGMASTLRLIANVVEPATGCVLPTALLLLSFVIIVQPYRCRTRFRKPHCTPRRTENGHNWLRRSLMTVMNNASGTSNNTALATNQSNASTSNNTVKAAASSADVPSSGVPVPVSAEIELGFELNKNEGMPRRDSLVLLGCLLFTSILLKSPFFVYRLSCELILDGGRGCASGWSLENALFAALLVGQALKYALLLYCLQSRPDPFEHNALDSRSIPPSSGDPSASLATHSQSHTSHGGTHTYLSSPPPPTTRHASDESIASIGVVEPKLECTSNMEEHAV